MASSRGTPDSEHPVIYPWMKKAHSGQSAQGSYLRLLILLQMKRLYIRQHLALRIANNIQAGILFEVHINIMHMSYTFAPNIDKEITMQRQFPQTYFT